ncbi:hypothetical protein Anas_12952, partial [Armadillidium nasatum]
ETVSSHPLNIPLQWSPLYYPFSIPDDQFDMEVSHQELLDPYYNQILEQCQSEDYRKKLRQKLPREDCSFHEKSMNARKKLRPRLSKTSVSKDSTDDGDLEKRSNNSKGKVSGSRNKQNNSNEKIGLENICQQNKNSFNFKLESNSSLEIFKKDNLNIKKFKCNYCSYKTKYERSYNAHCAIHKNVKLFKCNSCDFETNFKSGLVILLIYNKRKLSDENISIPSPAEPIKCSECNFEAEDQNCLDLHSQIHSEVHKCPECSYKSTDTETFKDHLIKIHLGDSTSESESVPYSLRKRSRQPNKTGTDESSDEEHNKISGKHKHEDSDFEDELVDDSDSEDELIDITGDYDKPLRKKRCNYATRKNENFVAHCLDHANKKVFKCDHCDFKTNYKRLSRNHKLNCIKNQENILSNCFNRAIDENVDYHSLSLSEIINLICNEDKSLDHNTSDETTTEVLKCLECTFETGNQKIFNFHSQIHVEEHKNIKLFKCDDCDFESNYKRHLVSHKLNRCSKKVKLNPNENCVSECFSIAIDENIVVEIKVTHLLTPAGTQK